jgi:hypothetical protein
VAAAATPDSTRIEAQLRALERPPRKGKPAWTWLVVAAGLMLVLSLGYHGWQSYSTIGRIDASARLTTADPIRLFQALATMGPQVPNTIENSQRSNYSRALEQFILDGTGLAIGLAIILAGLLTRINH